MYIATPIAATIKSLVIGYFLSDFFKPLWFADHIKNNEKEPMVNINAPL